MNHVVYIKSIGWIKVSIITSNTSRVPMHLFCRSLFVCYQETLCPESCMTKRLNSLNSFKIQVSVSPGGSGVTKLVATASDLIMTDERCTRQDGCRWWLPSDRVISASAIQNLIAALQIVLHQSPPSHNLPPLDCKNAFFRLTWLKPSSSYLFITIHDSKRR